MKITKRLRVCCGKGYATIIFGEWNDIPIFDLSLTWGGWDRSLSLNGVFLRRFWSVKLWHWYLHHLWRQRLAIKWGYFKLWCRGKI